MRGCVALALLLAGSPAPAAELFGGVLAHDVDTVFTQGGFERGVEVQLGWRGDRIAALGPLGGPSPYAFVSLAGGDTSLAAAGLSWRIGGPLFLRPGVGLAIHTRSGRGVLPSGLRTDLGSRILFEPELGIGYQLNERLAIEASWVHVSHAQLFSRQNPGMDSIGVRLSWRLR